MDESPEVFARQAEARRRWLAFSPDKKAKLIELWEAIFDREDASNQAADVEAFRGWWAANQDTDIAVDTQVDSHGQTLLFAATGHGRVELVRYLIEVCGAAIDLKDPYAGRTPLICAAHNLEAGCVRLLLELGADPNIREDEGKTAGECARELEWQEGIDIFEQWVPIPKVKSALKG